MPSGIICESIPFYRPHQVPGADPNNRLPDSKLYASLYSKGALPKLQSFKAAVHSNKKYLLIVGGRYTTNSL